jgi:tetratricopeptide (TPR) repeat protein
MESGTSRFRLGQVNAPATPAERIRRNINDGERVQELAIESLRDLISTWDPDGILEVLATVREHEDHHRVYLIHRQAANMLAAASSVVPHDDTYTWARYFDLIPDVLVPYLERIPAEPVLLNLLGVAYFELGETAAARRLFEAVRTLEPDFAEARANLKACKQREAQRGGVAQVPEGGRRRSVAARPAAKRLADIAVRLPEQKISLCMIVKDEEAMLPGCLTAIAPWVDEMIIVDTGSSDRTREIAEEHGARVIDFPWTGSFSDARNRSVEEATGDWILYLDADEHMVGEDGRILRQMAAKSWVEGFYIVLHNFTGELEMGTQTSHTTMRMFRNRPKYRWEGIIHEQKLHHFPTWLPERFQNLPVSVNHYGYLSQVREDRSKQDRNLELLLKQLEDGGDTAFTNFNIGSEYSAVRDWSAALPYLERALELMRAETPAWWEIQFAPLMVSRLISAREAMGQATSALELIDEMVAHWPEFTDLVYKRAVIHYHQGAYEEAIADGRRCLELGDAPARYVAIQGRGSFQARALLATVLRDMGDRAGAQRELELAMEEAPHFLPLILELADVRLPHDDADTVAAWFERVLGADTATPHANMLLATAFYEHGHLEIADRYYLRTLEASPGLCTARIGRAELLLAQGKADEAIDVIAQVSALDPMAALAARTWFLALVVAGRTHELDVPMGMIASAEHLPLGVRTVYTAWHAKVTGGLAVLPPDPSAADQIAVNLEALARLEAVEAFEALVELLPQALPDERARHLLLGRIYLRRSFADMAGEEYMYVAQQFGPDPEVLTGLGKVATMKEMWDDAVVFLRESLDMNPEQADARKLLELVHERINS